MEVKGTVAHLLGLSKLPGGESKLPPPGAKVTVTVQRYLGKGIWLLDLDGTRVEARSRLSLVPGQRLAALVKREGASLLLVTRERAADALSSTLRSAGIRDTSLGRRALSLLFSAGAAARPELLDRLATTLRRRREGRTGGRMEAESVVRGFRELPEELSALLPPIAGLGGGERRWKGGEEESRDGEPPSAAERLRKALFRSVHTGDHPLQLYNHRARLGSGWIALPIGFYASEARGGPESHFQGLLHIPIPESNVPSGSWTLDLFGEKVRYILVCRGSTALELQVTKTEAGTQGEAPELESALSRLLEEAGYTVRRSQIPFDGIEFKDHSDLQEGIDLLQ
jgi:hypothetical protein